MIFVRPYVGAVFPAIPCRSICLASRSSPARGAGSTRLSTRCPRRGVRFRFRVADQAVHDDDDPVADQRGRCPVGYAAGQDRPRVRRDHTARYRRRAGPAHPANAARAAGTQRRDGRSGADHVVSPADAYVRLLAPWRAVFQAAGSVPPPPAVGDSYDRVERWQRGLQAICGYPFVGQPGEAVRYSDLGFMLLGEVSARLNGTPAI